MENKFYSVAYKLFTIRDGRRELEEEATSDAPFSFISGFSTTIPSFENKIKDLTEGDEFDFTLSPADAYGEYVKERVIQLDKNIFQVDGVFRSDMIHEGAIIPLQNEDGNRFMGRVLSVGEEKVTVDLNHPLAGCDLQFQGRVLQSHEATNEEIQQIINQLSGGGCGGCSGGCSGGGCSGGGCSGDGCCKNE